MYRYVIYKLYLNNNANIMKYVSIILIFKTLKLLLYYIHIFYIKQAMYQDKLQKNGVMKVTKVSINEETTIVCPSEFGLFKHEKTSILSS